jgi:hypothetical protein
LAPTTGSYDNTDEIKSSAQVVYSVLLQKNIEGIFLGIVTSVSGFKREQIQKGVYFSAVWFIVGKRK